MNRDWQRHNVNVTLGISGYEPKRMAGKPFPCPICGASLEIRIARTHKPYCVCLDCGLQLFVRGKAGIARLQRIIDDELLVAGNGSNPYIAEVSFNRIQRLKQQKAGLERKQRLIFPDSDLAHAIQTVDNEIERVQAELHRLSRRTREDTKS